MCYTLGVATPHAKNRVTLFGSRRLLSGALRRVRAQEPRESSRVRHQQGNLDGSGVLLCLSVLASVARSRHCTRHGRGRVVSGGHLRSVRARPDVVGRPPAELLQGVLRGRAAQFQW